MSTAVNTLVRTSGDAYNNNVADAYSTQYTQQRQYYVMQLIKRLLPYLPLWKDAQKVRIPDNAGGFGTTGIISLRKFNSLAVSSAPLTEGTIPDGLNPTTATVSVNLLQYGDWIKVTDQLVNASIDDIMKEFGEVLAENAGRKLHQVMLDEFVTNVSQTIWGGTAVSAITLTNAMPISSTSIKKAVRYLENNNAPKFPDGTYHGFMHPYQKYDIMNDSLWQDVARYAGGAASGGGVDLIKGEIGQMHSVRFVESSDAPNDTAGAGSNPTYSSFVYGPNAFGVFDLKSQAVADIDAETGKGMEIHSIPVNTPTKDDPLGQFGLVGWKGSFAAKIIDNKRVAKIRTGATQ